MVKKTKDLNNKKSEYYRLIIKMNEKTNKKDTIFFLKKQILEALEEDKEIRESKKVFFDKKANQFSIKIPKSLALKSGLNKSPMVNMVFNLKEKETLEKIKKSKLVIFISRGENDRKKGQDK